MVAKRLRLAAGGDETAVGVLCPPLAGGARDLSRKRLASDKAQERWRR